MRGIGKEARRLEAKRACVIIGPSDESSRVEFCFYGAEK